MGAFAASGGQDVGVAGGGVAPSQVGLLLAPVKVDVGLGGTPTLRIKVKGLTVSISTLGTREITAEDAQAARRLADAAQKYAAEGERLATPDPGDVPAVAPAGPYPLVVGGWS